MARWLAFLRRLAALALLLAAAVPGGPVRAQSLESALAPGKLIQGHAKWEDECKTCHVRFRRAAQDGLCMDCHKEVGHDVRAKAGYHGRIAPQACRDCHTDHKGRDARIVVLDERGFDHRLTDFLLRGAHDGLACAKCHVPGKAWRAAPADCHACHRDDDPHKGSLGTKCADCHGERDWKEARFDHATTRFALTGRHADAKCAACHKDGRYKETPRQCVACHRKDDEGAKGHKGLYGEQCESCHGTKAWKPSSFNHDSATKFALRGGHRTAACGDCHTGHLYKAKPATECVGCHLKDDKHKGSLGRDCAGCHTEKNWKETPRFDHARTAFPLLGKHAEARCDACHRAADFKQAPTRCVACHREDDKHRATLGDDCGACHGERDWKTTRGRFDHDRTKFRLRNAHAAAKVQCKDCHRDLTSFRPTPLDCASCHRKDDRHEGQLGTRCESCHDDRGWKVPGFDHRRTRFPLVGRHMATACKDCHASPRFQDAKRECVACHRDDDKHRQAFGSRCESCHNARAWALWDFDHDGRSRFRLEGAHRRVACASCHTQRAPDGRDSAPLAESCVSCHRRDDVHDGAFGARCEQCHAAEDWKKLSNRVMRTSQAATPTLPKGWLP